MSLKKIFLKNLQNKVLVTKNAFKCFDCIKIIGHTHRENVRAK